MGLGGYWVHNMRAGIRNGIQGLEFKLGVCVGSIWYHVRFL